MGSTSDDKLKVASGEFGTPTLIAYASHQVADPPMPAVCLQLTSVRAAILGTLLGIAVLLVIMVLIVKARKTSDRHALQKQEEHPASYGTSTVLAASFQLVIYFPAQTAVPCSTPPCGSAQTNIYGRTCMRRYQHRTLSAAGSQSVAGGQRKHDKRR